MRKLVFLGASALPELAELVRDINAVAPSYEMVAALDDDPASHGTTVEGIPVEGPLDAVSEFPGAAFVFGVGSFRTRLVRADILSRLNLPDDSFETLIHPMAKVYSTADVGRGSIIHCGAVIGNGARLGRWSIVLWNSVIGADNVLGDGVLVASGVSTNSNVKIGSFSFIGAGSAVAENVAIGPGALVAMGSVVLRDVADGVFQMGDPPRVLSREEVPEHIRKDWQRLVRG